MLFKGGTLFDDRGQVCPRQFQVTVDSMRTTVVRSVVASVFLGLCLIVMSGTTLGQISTATVSGTATDNGGARLPNTETGLSTTSVTNSDGAYTIPSLPIGTYQIEAQREGFKTSIRGPFVLTVGLEATVHFVLTVGQVSESVEVAADVPEVD